MFPLTIAEIVQATGGILVIGDPKTSVGIHPSEEEVSDFGIAKGVSTDSRTLRKRDIYFALKGVRYDGHDFIEQSIQRGTSLCVVSCIPSNLIIPVTNSPAIIKVKDTKKALADCAGYYCQKYGVKTRRVGVSGSNGKTTVKEMIAQILSRAGSTIYNVGNFNNDVGCPLSLFNLVPDHQYAVFEIGASVRGEVKRLSEIVAPQVAVVTNIGLEHTATFGNLDDIAAGESEILQVLPEDGFAVFPRDDAYFEFLKSVALSKRNIKIKSFGFSKEASVYISDVHSYPGPVQFTLIHQDEKGHILHRIKCNLPVLGRFNMINACAAAAAALCLNVDEKCIVDGLKNFLPPQMRFQIMKLENNVIVVNDCYNANPSSMRVSLESFVEFYPNQTKCVVLGDMLELGEISKSEHYSLGKFLAGLPLSKIVLFGPQSRFVAEGARDSFLREKMVTHCSDAESLLKTVRSLMQPRTAIFFKASREMYLENVIQQLTHGTFHFTVH